MLQLPIDYVYLCNEKQPVMSTIYSLLASDRGCAPKLRDLNPPIEIKNFFVFVHDCFSYKGAADEKNSDENENIFVFVFVFRIGRKVYT